MANGHGGRRKGAGRKSKENLRKQKARWKELCKKSRTLSTTQCLTPKGARTGTISAVSKPRAESTTERSVDMSIGGIEATANEALDSSTPICSSAPTFSSWLSSVDSQAHAELHSGDNCTPLPGDHGSISPPDRRYLEVGCIKAGHSGGISNGYESLQITIRITNAHTRQMCRWRQISFILDHGPPSPSTDGETNHSCCTDNRASRRSPMQHRESRWLMAHSKGTDWRMRLATGMVSFGPRRGSRQVMHCLQRKEIENLMRRRALDIILYIVSRKDSALPLM